MPVFFVHDPSQGIITPLDRKFHVRAVDQADAIAASPPIHPRTDHGIAAAYQQTPTARPGTRYDADEASPDDLPPDPLAELCVRDIMSTPALCGRTTQTLLQAWETLQQYEIHHLAIVDANMALQGLLSSNQMLHFVLRHPGPIDQVPLTQFCGKTVLSTHPDVTVRDLAAALLEQGLDGVPVCEGGQLIGMVTYTDIIKTLLARLSFQDRA
jgi:CBS domain-containing protein